MPTGEILRTGPWDRVVVGSVVKVPGPSQGVARGFLGAKGSMGVFTRCAVKLFAWPGPATLPVEGTIPAYSTLA